MAWLHLERFSIEYRIAKSKEIALMNQKRRKHANEKLELEPNTCNRSQARENACEQGTIVLGLASHWLRKWCKLC